MFPLPLVVEPVPSALWRRVVAAATALAVGAILLSNLPGTIQGLLAALAILLGIRAWKSGREIRLRCTAKGGLEIWADGAWRTASLAPGSAAGPYFILLRLRGRPPRAVFIGPDSLDRDAYRRFATWLRWKATAALPHSPSA